jgi:hypothetical protein
MSLNKKFIFIFSVLLLCQVIFSFVYNSQIIDQNSLLWQQMAKKQQLQLENQKLQLQLSTLTSIKTLEPIIKKTPLNPIKNNLKIQN